MQERIQQLTAELQALTAHSEQEVEDLRIKYISKKGLVSQLFDEFKTVPNEEKRQVGQLLNALKTLATDKINELRASLRSGYRLVTYGLPHSIRLTPSADDRSAGDLLHIRTPWLLYCRRT